MYKITATIHKPGGLPVSWFRRSPKKLSRRECENMIYRSKETGRSFGDKITLTDFKCEEINAETNLPAEKPANTRKSKKRSG